MKPRVKILATGGTIAGVQKDETQTAYTSAVVRIAEVIEALPSLGNLAEISYEQIANIGSQDMDFPTWRRLLVRIAELFSDENTDGVVVTHGTDTLEETAYFLSLTLESFKPIVLVGSMQPASAIGSSGLANLYNAVALAATPEAGLLGPLILLNDVIHGARDARKTNTTQSDAFRSPNSGPLGVMNTGKAWFYSRRGLLRERQNGENELSFISLQELETQKLPYVEIVYAYAGMDGKPIDSAVSRGAQGIVLAGVGNGNASNAAFGALKRAAEKGIAVVRSSRVGSGIVDRNIETDDDRFGFVAAMDHSPQKARILLMLGLLKTRDVDLLQQYFVRY